MTTATIIRVKSSVTELPCGKLGKRYQKCVDCTHSRLLHRYDGCVLAHDLVGQCECRATFETVKLKAHTPVCPLALGHAEPCKWGKR